MLSDLTVSSSSIKLLFPKTYEHAVFQKEGMQMALMLKRCSRSFKLKKKKC